MKTIEQEIEADKPLPSDPAEALLHVRAQLRRAADLTVQAAEAKYPGLERLIGRLIRQEAELERRQVSA